MVKHVPVSSLRVEARSKRGGGLAGRQALPRGEEGARGTETQPAVQPVERVRSERCPRRREAGNACVDRLPVSHHDATGREPRAVRVYERFSAPDPGAKTLSAGPGAGLRPDGPAGARAGKAAA